MDSPTPGDIIASILEEATQVHKLYQSEDGARRLFAEYMRAVAAVLKLISGNMPQRAMSVVLELENLVSHAKSKLTKLNSGQKHPGNSWPDCWRLCAEMEAMRTTTQHMQRLLPILMACCVTASDASESAAYLRREAASLQDSEPDVAAHLVSVQATISTVAAPHATQEHVKQCMAVLNQGMIQLQQASREKVLDAHNALMRQFMPGQDSLERLVDTHSLGAGFLGLSIHMREPQQDMQAHEVMKCLAMQSGISAKTAQSMQQTRIAAAISDLIVSEPDEAFDRLSTIMELASAVRAAAFAGTLTIMSCWVLGIPIMPAGPLRPVSLPCCGLVVSCAGAQKLLARGQCCVCMLSLAAAAELTDDEPVTAAVTAEIRGYVPRKFNHDEVKLGGIIGDAGRITVHEGTVGLRPVAVKRIRVRDVARAGKHSTMQRVSRMYLAGLGSPYVVSLHGYCWSDSETWLVMERCDGSLVDLVQQARELGSPSLPPADVVALGLMLCSALSAVHLGARCAHLRVHPRTVLCAGPAATAGADSKVRGVRLAGPGLSLRPAAVDHPGKVSDETTDIEMLRYAPREQVLGRPQRSCDIYSLGATLLYAATGMRPYSGGNMPSVNLLVRLISGERMPLSDSVKPAALRDLLAHMTAVEPSSRPTLPQVQQRLLQVHSALLADGASVRFIAPVDGTLIPASGVLKPLKDPADAGGTHAGEECGLSSTPDRVSDSADVGQPAARGSPCEDVWLTQLLGLSISPSSDEGVLCQILHRLVSALLLHLGSCVLATCGQGGRDAHAHSACMWFKHIRTSQISARSSVEPAVTSKGTIIQLLKMLGRYEGEAGDAKQTQGEFGSATEPIANDGAVCKQAQEEPGPALLQRLGYGAILLGKANARLGSPACTVRNILTSMATSAAILARALDCIQALQHLSAGSADDASSVLISISQKLFLYWADFSNGMMQLFQGTINVAAALRCSVSSDFISAAAEQFNDGVTTGSNATLWSTLSSDHHQAVSPGAKDAASTRHDGIIVHTTETGHRKSDSEHLDEARQQTMDDTEPQAQPEASIENVKAVFIPNLLFRLGMKQIRVLLEVNDGADTSEMSDALKLFVQGNIMRMNWSNAAVSGLWKSMPVKFHEETLQRRTVGKCPETYKFYRPEGPQLPLARLCCGVATSEEGLRSAANSTGEILCPECKGQMQASDIEECDVFEDEFDAACMADSAELQSFLRQQLPAASVPRDEKQAPAADHEVSPATLSSRIPSGSPDAIAVIASELGRDMFWESPKVSSFVERLPLQGVPVEQNRTSARDFLQLYDLDGFLGMPDFLAPATVTSADSRAAFLSQAEQERLRQVCVGEHTAAFHSDIAALVLEACTLANPGIAAADAGQSNHRTEASRPDGQARVSAHDTRPAKLSSEPGNPTRSPRSPPNKPNIQSQSGTPQELFSGKVLGSTEVQTVESLASWLQSGHSDLLGQHVRLTDMAPSSVSPPLKKLEPHLDAYSKSLSFVTWHVEAATEATCWDLAQQSAHLRNATIRIPPHGVLRVHASEAGASWHNVSVKGGNHSMVVVHGSMLFKAVTFDGCTLVAETSAAVEVDSSNFANARVAVCAAATGGKVILSNTTVRECQHGVVATCGATVTLAETYITCAGDGSCLTVQGNGTLAIITSGCTLTSHADTPSSARWRGCIAVIQGASARLEGVTLSAAPSSRGVGGLLMHGTETKATLTNCNLRVTANAVIVDAAASAKLHECNLSGGRTGLFVSGAGSQILASGCKVTNCNFSCADIRRGAVMDLEDCTLSNSAEQSGVSIWNQGSFAKLRRCAMLRNAKWGLFLAGGARAEVTEGRAEHNTLDGAYVFTASTAVLTRFKMAASTRAGGLIVSDPGSSVHSEGCDFSVNALHGARAYNGGVLRAVKCTAFQNGSRRAFNGILSNAATSGASGSSALEQMSPGPVPALSGSDPLHAWMSLQLADYPDSDANACGFYAYGEGSTVDVSRESSSTYNCAGGYTAAHGAKLVVSGSTGAHNGGPGAAVCRGASGTFQNCEFADSCAGSGVEAHDIATTINVHSCKVARNARGGVYVIGGAKATVKNVEVTENKGDGLLLHGIGSRGDVEALVAAQNEGCGALVQQQAELDAAYCTLKCNMRAGVRVNACGRATVRNASVRDTSAGSGVDVANPGSQATLVSCEVVQSHQYGALVWDSAVLEVLGSMAPTNLEKNRLSNVRVESRGFARLHDSFLCASLERSGLNVEGCGSAARAVKCTLSENALCGAIVQDGARIECERVTAHRNRAAGVCVQVAAAAKLSKVKLSGCREGSGLLVHGRGSSAKLADCQSMQNSDAGIQVQHGAHVTAHRCHTARNSRAGVAVDAASVLEMKKCKSEDTTPFTASKGSRGLVRVDCLPA